MNEQKQHTEETEEDLINLYAAEETPTSLRSRLL